MCPNRYSSSGPAPLHSLACHLTIAASSGPGDSVLALTMGDVQAECQVPARLCAVLLLLNAAWRNPKDRRPDALRGFRTKEQLCRTHGRLTGRYMLTERTLVQYVHDLRVLVRGCLDELEVALDIDLHKVEDKLIETRRKIGYRMPLAITVDRFSDEYDAAEPDA